MEEIKEFEFITEYEHNGLKYSSSLWATDFEDAERHLKSKKENETVVGYIPDKIYTKKDGLVDYPL